MFVQLMPLFSAIMAIVIFGEKFEFYHLEELLLSMNIFIK